MLALWFLGGTASGLLGTFGGHKLRQWRDPECHLNECADVAGRVRVDFDSLRCVGHSFVLVGIFARLGSCGYYRGTIGGSWTSGSGTVESGFDALFLSVHLL